MSNVLSIREFPQELLRRVKVQAAMKGITMRQLVIDSLERTLKEEESGKSTRAVKPRKQ